jgi:hypothetical protein
METLTDLFKRLRHRNSRMDKYRWVIQRRLPDPSASST